MPLSKIARSLPPSLKRNLKKILRAARGAHRPSEPKQPAAPAVQRETEQGKVTSVTTTEISGTLEIPTDSEPIRVKLFVNDLEIDHVDVPPAVSGTANFRFPVKGIWRFCSTDDQITVRTGDARLTMPEGDLYFSPKTAGKETVAALAARLQAGEIINSAGILTLPKYLDQEWQRRVTDLHQKVHEAVMEISGNETFLIYGSLLGAVREGRPLGHDYDLDSAYLSKHSDPALATAEAGRIALSLQEQGFFVEARVTCIHVSDPDRTLSTSITSTSTRRTSCGSHGGLRATRRSDDTNGKGLNRSSLRAPPS